MKTVRIRVAEARIPKNISLTHISTSYRISRTTDMTEEKDIIFESIEDSVNLREIIVDLDIAPYETVYCSTRYHYIDGDNVNFQSKWSLPAPIQGDKHGITYPDTIVKTPKVKYNINEDGIFTIETSPMEIFTGLGHLETTSWYIRDSDNHIVYLRPNDKDNTTKLYPEFKPEKNKAYIIEAIHSVTGNNDSYSGKAVMLNYSVGTGLYDFEVISKFFVNTNVWHRLKIYLPNFKEYDLEIRKPDGTVVKKLYNCPTLVYYVNTFGFNYNQMYEWWVRVRFTDDSVTDFKKEWEGLALDADEYPNWDEDPNIAFLGKIADGPTFDIESETNDNTCINSYEIINKEFLYVIDGKICLLKWENNLIYKLKDLIDLRQFNTDDVEKDEDTLIIPYCTFTKFSDTEVLIHYRIQNNNDNFGKTVFLLCDYNYISKELKIKFKNEIHIKENVYGIANHLVRTDENIYYGVFETDPTLNPIKEGLYLLKIEVTEDTINLTRLCAIKKGRFAFVRIFVNRKKDIFFIGGSVGSITNIDNSELIYKRDNNFVKKIDVKKLIQDVGNNINMLPDDFDVTKNVTSVPVEYSPFEVYDYMPVSLGSGDILLWNNCNSGRQKENQNLLIFSTVSLVFRFEKYDLKLKVPFRNIVRFLNWDILRISSNVESKQKTYLYLSVQNNEEDFKDSTEELEYPKTLSFKDKNTNIEVPYHFECDHLAINPPMEKTLNWVDKRKYRELTYSNIMYSRSQLEPPLEDGLPVEHTKGINLLNNVHLRVGLGQAIGENSYQVGHGNNPWPYEPYLKLPDDPIEIYGTEKLELTIDHNLPELDYEITDAESNNLIRCIPGDPDEDKYKFTIIGKNIEGHFKFNLIGLGVDGEPSVSTIVEGNTYNGVRPN